MILVNCQAVLLAELTIDYKFGTQYYSSDGDVEDRGAIVLLKDHWYGAASCDYFLDVGDASGTDDIFINSEGIIGPDSSASIYIYNYHGDWIELHGHSNNSGSETSFYRSTSVQVNYLSLINNYCRVRIKTNKNYVYLDILRSRAIPESLQISGPTTVNENSSASYSAKLLYEGGYQQYVTNIANWNENSSYASINSSGTLTTNSVSSDKSCKITATYGGKSNTHTVTIKNVAPTLDHITISGSTSVNESSGAQYTCKAYYSDGSNTTVTSSASWNENSSYTTISGSGYLSTSSVSSDKSCTITASYGGKSDTHSVTIKNVAATLSSITISGSTQVNESWGSIYTCTANYSDGSTSNVSNSASWGENSAYASISSSGTLTTLAVSSDKSCTITASYGGKSDTHSVTIKNVAATLSSITISGSTSVNESSGAQYTCKAYYSDSSSSTVTSSASWNENSSYASINGSGYLTANSVSSDKSCTITATYGGKSDTHNITIKNVATTKPTVTITATDAQTTEVTSGTPIDYANFRVTRTGDTSSQLVVYFSKSGSASWPSDYVWAGGPDDIMVIQPGSSYADYGVRAVDDTLQDGTETITWTLSSNSAYTVGSPSTANINIIDNEPALPSYTLSVNSSGASGVIISSTTGHSGKTNYTKSVLPATSVTLTAPPTAGGKPFAGWTGSVTSNSRAIPFSMTGNKTVTANYTASGSITPQSLPCTQDFSSGKPGNSTGWEYFSDDEGRIAVVGGQLRMDDNTSGSAYSLNEAILHLDLSGKSNVTLKLDHISNRDENDSLPNSFTGHANADGIAISSDGNTWYLLTQLTSNFTGQVFDLDNAVQSAGISYNSDFQVKFQQYDNYPYSSDGRTFDNIIVTAASNAVISDNFNDNLTDGLLWQLWMEDCENCSISETNQRLEITSTGNSNIKRTAAYVSHGWLLDVTKDFSFKIDYHYNPVTSSDAGLILSLTPDPAFPKDISLDVGCDNNSRYFYYELIDEFHPDGLDDDCARNTTDGTLYISYDASLDELYFSYSGYGTSQAWKTISNLLQDDWKATPLHIGFGGYSTEVALSSGDAWLDNFELNTGTTITPVMVNKKFNGLKPANNPNLCWLQNSGRKNSASLMYGPKYSQLSSNSSNSNNIVGLEDLTGNGKPDLLWHNSSSKGISGTTLNGLVKTQNRNMGGNQQWKLIALTDFNADGNRDIIWQDENRGVYAGTITNSLAKTQTKGLGGNRQNRIVALADFNGDNKTDIIWRNTLKGTYSASIMDGMTKTQDFNLGGSNKWLIVALPDFNGDGKSDLLWREMATGKYFGTIMNGASKVQTKGLGGSNLLQIIDMPDFNADGKPDILWKDISTGRYLAITMNGLSKIQTRGLGGSDRWKIAALPDFNGDGYLDILWKDLSTGKYVGRIMNGLNKVQDRGLGGNNNWKLVALPDFDGDGKSDILWHETASSKYVAILMNGLSRANTRGLGTSNQWQMVALPDFNADGNLDILWQNRSTGKYVGTTMDCLIKTSNRGF
jgi:hypothetical protein